MTRMNSNLANICLDIYKNHPKYESYREQDNALHLLFEQYPLNSNIEEVLLKVVALNDFYSTNIMNIHAVASHIVKLQIDNKLQKHEMNIVPLIANVNFAKKGNRCFYSFATKYCSMHFPQYYPIVDKHVKNVLKLFRTDGYSRFKNKELADYNIYCSIVKDFNVFYNLNLELRELDHVLWIYDKEKDSLLVDFINN